MSNPPRIPDSIKPFFAEEPFLLNGLRAAIYNADMWWAKQFFGLLIKKGFWSKLYHQLPYLVASCCYHRFHTLLGEFFKDPSVKNMWICIEELVLSVKSMDALALSASLNSFLVRFVEKDDIVKSVFRDFRKYTDSGMLTPETLDLIPSWPITYGQMRNLMAMEFLLQTRRPSVCSLYLPSDIINMEPTPLPYYYTNVHNYVTDLEYVFTQSDEFSVYSIIDTVLFLLVVYRVIGLPVSIAPNDGDPPPTHINSFIWQHLLSSLANHEELLLDNIVEFCDLDFSCEF